MPLYLTRFAAGAILSPGRAAQRGSSAGLGRFTGA
jgi:hypothetical protein